jgi:PEP-CTERM motif
MFRTIRTLAAVALGTVLLGQAAAATTLYAFSFSNEEGAVSGAVAGTVTLPDGDGTFAAIALAITAAPAALGLALPATLAALDDPAFNAFVVTGGAISAAASHYVAVIDAPYMNFGLNFGLLGSFLTPIGGGPLNGVHDTGNATLRYAAVPLPEPLGLGLLVVGAAGLCAVRGRRVWARNASRDHALGSGRDGQCVGQFDRVAPHGTGTPLSSFGVVMFRSIRSLVIAAGIVLASQAAEAVTLYSFTFSNADGAISGTVAGTITLPDGDGTYAATAISITSAPAALGYTLPIDPLSWGPQFVNTFTVVGGAIDKALSSFAKEASPGTPSHMSFSLNFPDYGSLLSAIGGGGYSSGVQDIANASLRYAAVPEPASLGLLVLGAVGMAATGRYRGTDRRR